MNRCEADDTLVARAQEGDSEAFAILVARYKRIVHHLAYQMLGNSTDAEDAAQETFVRAYTRLGTYAPEGKFGAWVTAICSHWCVDALRARGRRVKTVALGQVLESDRFTSRIAGPEERVLSDDTHDQIERWLDALPAQYRAVLALRYWHDLSYGEIATMVNQPISTVRMRLFRARTMFQQLALREDDEWTQASRPTGLSPRPRVVAVAPS